jgi:hypothetical protein
MSAEWARDTDWNLSKLYSSTVFKLTFVESINKRHSAKSCWCPRASIIKQIIAKYYIVVLRENLYELILVIAKET